MAKIITRLLKQVYIPKSKNAEDIINLMGKKNKIESALKDFYFTREKQARQKKRRR